MIEQTLDIATDSGSWFRGSSSEGERQSTALGSDYTSMMRWFTKQLIMPKTDRLIS